MRSERDKPGQARGRRQAAQRQLDRALWLLRGWPEAREGDALRWRLLPRLGERESTRPRLLRAADIAEMRRQLDELIRRFPRALPEIVDDVDGLRAAVTARLDVAEQLLARPASTFAPVGAKVDERFGRRDFEREQLAALRKRASGASLSVVAATWWWSPLARERRRFQAAIDELAELLDATAALDVSGERVAADLSVDAAVMALALSSGGLQRFVARVLAFAMESHELGAPLRTGVLVRDVALAAPPGSRRVSAVRADLLEGAEDPRPALLACCVAWGQLARAERAAFGALLIELLPLRVASDLRERAARRDRDLERAFERLAEADTERRTRVVCGQISQALTQTPRLPMTGALQDLGRRIAPESDANSRWAAAELRRVADTLAAFPDLHLERGDASDRAGTLRPLRLVFFTHLAERSAGAMPPLAISMTRHARACRGDVAAAVAPWLRGELLQFAAGADRGRDPDEPPLLPALPGLLACYREGLESGLRVPGNGFPDSSWKFWSAVLEFGPAVMLRSLPAIHEGMKIDSARCTGWLRPGIAMSDGDPSRLRSLFEALPRWEQHGGALFEIRKTAAIRVAASAIADRDDEFLARLADSVRRSLPFRLPGRLRRRVLALFDVMGADFESAVASEASVPSAAVSSQLPQELVRLAARLLAVRSARDGSAEVAAVCARHVRESPALQAEIDGLQRRIADTPAGARRDGMTKRLTALRERMHAGGQDVRVVRRMRRDLQRRLERALRDRALRRLERQLIVSTMHGVDPELRARLRERARGDARCDRVLEGVLRCDEPWRQLGLQLLDDGAETPPAGLVELPANRRRLEELRQLGVRLDVWLGGSRALQFRHRDRVFTLGLAVDPLDVLWMGAPFGTCLSPGDVNFFAAIANAVDIDKRVLLCRDDASRIVGRCLLVLDRAGHLLTYHVYCHDAELELAGRVARFVRELAVDLGVETAGVGSASSVVGPDWYDDGSVDLEPPPAWAASDAPLARELGRATVGNVAEVLSDHLVDAPETAWTGSRRDYRHLLRMAAFREQRRLVLPLVPRLLHAVDLSMLVEVGLRIRDAADRDALRQVVEALERREAEASLEDLHEIARLALDVDPAITLRLVRGRSPQQLEEWYDSDYLVLDAQLALGRWRDARRGLRDLRRSLRNHAYFADPLARYARAVRERRHSLADLDSVSR